MDNTDQARARIGMEVVDDSGHFIGTVEHVEPDHFVVQKGFFFPNSHRIPNSAISEMTDREIRLRISRETAMHATEDENWAEKPEHGEIVPDMIGGEKPANKSDSDPHTH